MTATATAPKKTPPTATTYPVRESWYGPGAALADGQSRIDTAGRVIRGVKVVGLESVNTARLAGFPDALGEDVIDLPYGYSQDALKDALPLYEGARVFFDHPDSGIDDDGRRITSSGDRKFSDRLGRLVNCVYVEGQGIFADLQYLASDPLTPKLLEAAETMPETIALSHRAFVQPARVNGRVVVVKISHVSSVDLITENPGTTISLFESASQMAGEPEKKPEPPKTTESIPGALPGTTEMDPGNMPGGAAPAAPTDPKTAITDGIVAAAVAVIKGEGTAADKLTKLKTLLEQQEAFDAAMGGGSSGGGTETAKESARSAELIRLQLRDKAAGILEAAGIKVTTARVAVIAATPEADHKAVLGEYARMDGTTLLESTAIPARSGGGKEGTQPADEWNADDFEKRLSERTYCHS